MKYLSRSISANMPSVFRRGGWSDESIVQRIQSEYSGRTDLMGGGPFKHTEIHVATNENLQCRKTLAGTPLPDADDDACPSSTSPPPSPFLCTPGGAEGDKKSQDGGPEATTPEEEKDEEESPFSFAESFPGAPETPPSATATGRLLVASPAS